MAGSLMLINPRKRRKSGAKKRKYSRNPVRSLKRRSLKRRYRRNPIGGISTGIMGTMQSGAIGAAGAIGAKVISSFLPIPATMKTGAMAPLIQALIGAGFGMAVGKFANRKMGEQIGAGAVTVALYNAMHGALAGKVPGLSAFEYEVIPGGDDMSAYDMSAYDMAGMDEDENEYMQQESIL